MPKYPPTSRFEIMETRRLGLDRCEFVVRLLEGTVSRHDLFQIIERGTLWEWVVLDVREGESDITLLCMNWVPESGAFVGEHTSGRAMKAVERKRYAKYLNEVQKQR